MALAIIVTVVVTLFCAGVAGALNFFWHHKVWLVCVSLGLLAGACTALAAAVAPDEPEGIALPPPPG